MHQRDEADAGVGILVYDVNNKERPPWGCCSNSSVPRSEVIFSVPVSIIVLMIILCFIILFFGQKVAKKNQFGLHCCQSQLVIFYQIENYEQSDSDI